MTKQQIIKRAVARLREPSTYAGLAVVAGALGIQLDPGLLKAIANLGMAAAGLAAIVMPEGG